MGTNNLDSELAVLLSAHQAVRDHFEKVFEGILHVAQHRDSETHYFYEGWLYQWVHSTEEGRAEMEAEMIALPNCCDGCDDE